ncbi:hypothetical protein Leryth_005021 [Lithospermum erythrorhizon]|nr:hypothetical protein Leryth_005021 [Lithospermum erythrorhizon]
MDRTRHCMLLTQTSGLQLSISVNACRHFGPWQCLGATVTGIDVGDKNIQFARSHADLDPTTSSIEYLCTTAEN